MTLADVCEPLFLYVCRLNRSARSGGSCDLDTVRSEINGLFSDIAQAAGAQPEVAEQYDKVEIPLKFWVDSMLVEGRLNISEAWHKDRLAYEWNELAGDEKFFDLLDETLADPSKEATERLIIFYTCLGLGFVGFYAGKPEYIKKKQNEIANRIRDRIETSRDAKTCPEAYEHLDTRDLIEPPGRKLTGIVIVLVGMIITLFVANMFLYRRASRDLSDALRIIIKHDPLAPEPEPEADDPDAEAPADEDEYWGDEQDVDDRWREGEPADRGREDDGGWGSDEDDAPAADADDDDWSDRSDRSDRSERPNRWADDDEEPARSDRDRDRDRNDDRSRGGGYWD